MSLLPYKVTAIKDFDATGQNVMPYASVSVLNKSGGYAALKTDDTGATPLGNPFTCDVNGEKEFWILGGSYIITVDGGQSWEIQLSGASDIQYIENVAALASTPVVAGRTYYLKEYRAGTGFGGGELVGVAGSTIYDNGLTFAGSGGYFRRINYTPALFFESFGVVAGEADSRAKCQTAINSMQAAFPKGFTLRFAGGIYNLSGNLIIGNGNEGSTPSTSNGQKIYGSGSGLLSSPPTEIIYTGASSSAHIFQFAGRISDCDLGDMFLNLGGNCNGVYLGSFGGGRLSRLKISNPKEYGLVFLGGGAPVGNYNIFNKVEQVKIDLFTPGSTGLWMHGVYGPPVNNDTWITTFEMLRIECVGGALNAKCAHFKFVDSCTFIRCHFNSIPEPTATGILFDAMDNHTFPGGMSFYDCSVDSTAVLEDATHKIGDSYFYGAGVYDNEVIPTHPSLKGITAVGKVFGAQQGYSKQSAVDFNVQNTTTDTTVHTFNVPAYFLGGYDTHHQPNSFLRLKLTAAYINASGANANLTITVTYGGQTVASIPFTAIATNASGRYFELNTQISLTNSSVTNQTAVSTAKLGNGGTSGSTAGAIASELSCINSALTVNSAVAHDLIVRAQHSVAAGSIAFTVKNVAVEYLR